MWKVKAHILSPSEDFKLDYKTTTGKTYPLTAGYASFSSKLVPVDPISTIEACRNGCSLYGRNGGCPPFSPNFLELSRSYFLVLYAKILTKYYPPKVLNGPYYTRWVFVETFLKALTKHIGESLSSSLDCYFFNSGHCDSCKPKRCAVKDGKPCRKPDARTHSLEATGVLVTELLKDVFGIELLWWRPQEPNYIPKYMVKVIGVSREKAFNAEETRRAILSAFNHERILVREYQVCDKSPRF